MNLTPAWRTLGCIVILSVSVLAQSHHNAAAPPAATGPDFDVSAGYAYLRMSTPRRSGVNLNGVDASASVRFLGRWGATLDGSGVFAGNVLGTGYTGSVVSLLAGPVFYAYERRNRRVFLRGMVGASRVDSALPISGTYYRYGWLERFSYAVGGGMEKPLSGPFTLRIAGDYLHTTFEDTAAVPRPQNNLRLTASFVYRIHPR